MCPNVMGIGISSRGTLEIRFATRDEGPIDD